MFDLHEPVIVVETLFKQCRGTSVIVKQTRLAAVFRHYDEDLVFLWLAVELFPDYGQDTVIFASHVVEIAHIP